ncbi:MAG: ABC transporter substrate-binding protein [Aphanocapsa sp. GSE-SYN-MK-11-07L]|nr:ABC transporter substrate-binding protein [Aphanocapsa sp. GSE-SYN-MK-11-07L]
MRRILGLGLLAILSGGCDRPSGSTNATLGIALPRTSNLALIGQEQLAGVKIAEQMFNQQGGIDGKPIQFAYQDIGNDEAGAINAFQTLISQSRVVGLVGPTTSQQAFSAAPIADRAGVPVICPSTIANGIPQIGQYVSRVAASAEIVSPNAVKAALKLNPNLKRVAVFYAQDQDALVSETKFFQQAAKAQGLQVLTVQRFQTTDTDFQTQATTALNLKPDLVIISGLVADGGNLVKQLRELGYKGLIIGGNGLNTANIFPVCQNFCDGILIAQAYSPAEPGQMNAQFRKAYVDQFKKDPPQFSAQSFTAVQVFVEALRSLNQQTPISKLALTKLRSQLNQQLLKGKYDTPLGEISFTPEGELIKKDFYVAQIKMQPGGKTGKFVFLP